MASTITCPKCKMVSSRQGMVKVVTNTVRYYCPKCAKSNRSVINKAINKQKDKEEQEKLTGETKARDSRELAELVDYICVLYNTSKPNMVALKQIKEYRAEYDYRYAGMELALKYFYELEGKSTENSHGVGIIPYVYDKAREHAVRKIEIKRNAKGMEAETLTFKEGNKRTTKRRIGIDLDDLEVE